MNIYIWIGIPVFLFGLHQGVRREVLRQIYRRGRRLWRSNDW